MSTGGLVLDGVSRRVGGRFLLRRLSLRVRQGECLALLGPSGCGKSTTLRLVAGLDPPSEGRILLGDRDITSLPAGRRQVAMVFQSYALYPHLSVEGNLALGLRVRGVEAAERQRRIATVLELLQLQELRRRRPAELSGGQRQRVALARALLRQPQLVLLDEPMSNLDAQLREELRPELRRLLVGGEQPVLYVTHDQQEALGMADRIAVIDQGRLQQVGTPRQLYDDPANRFVAEFIGRPAINLLATAEGRQVGVRPEHVRIDPAADLPARVDRREWWGHEQLVWLETPRGRMRMLVGGDVHLDDTLHISWPRERELCFAARSGERIF